jgi:hypothetical protein
VSALRMPILAAVVALGCAIGCANTPAVVITSRSVQALNDTFVGTAAVMNAAYDSGRITWAQYEKWKAFGLRFQASAALAKKLFDAADEAKDASVRAHAEAILRDFQDELATYAALALQVAHPDGGT